MEQTTNKFEEEYKMTYFRAYLSSFIINSYCSWINALISDWT